MSAACLFTKTGGGIFDICAWRDVLWSSQHLHLCTQEHGILLARLQWDSPANAAFSLSDFLFVGWVNAQEIRCSHGREPLGQMTKKQWYNCCECLNYIFALVHFDVCVWSNLQCKTETKVKKRCIFNLHIYIQSCPPHYCVLQEVWTFPTDSVETVNMVYCMVCWSHKTIRWCESSQSGNLPSQHLDTRKMDYTS